MEEQTTNLKSVYTIVDRGGKTFWVRIGVGFTNRDGSLNLRLDAVPVNATLHVRDWEPSEKRAEGGEAQARARPARAGEASMFAGVEAEPSPRESAG
jgi:hypothetical protein